MTLAPILLGRQKAGEQLMRTRSKLSFLFAAAMAGLGLASQAGAAPNVPFNGSGIESTFSYSAGQTVSFQYNLVTASNTAAAGFQDFAYYTFDSKPVTVLASENSATIANSDVYTSGFMTGYQTVTFVAAASGTLGFGVVNVGDGNTGTALLVDNIKVNGVQIPNGGFAAFPDFTNYTTVGNASVQGDLPSIPAPDGDGAQALISDTATALNSIPVPVSIAALEAGTNVPAGGLTALAGAVNGGSSVPLPAGMYLAPLGLILAGVYSRKLRRTAAC